MHEQIIFFTVLIIILILGGVFARLARGITFCGTNTDNQKQVVAAARISEWIWPSDMHKYASGKAWMKDTVVLGLTVVQRVLGDRKSDYPLVVLCILSNSLSALLIFLIAKGFWTLSTAVVVFLLFVTSVWIHQLALYGAAHCIAQAYFLTSIYFLQQGSPWSIFGGGVWYFLGGVAFGLMLFSSASSRKYVPLFIAMFLYSQRHLIVPVWLAPPESGKLFSFSNLVMIGPLFLFLSAIIVSRISYNHLIPYIDLRQISPWVSRFRKEREYSRVERYQNYVAKALRLVGNGSLLTFAFLVLCLTLSRSVSFYVSLMLTVSGASIVVFLLIYPHPIKNLVGYVNLAGGLKTGGHFRHYVQYFSRTGHNISIDMRGAGLAWIIRFFWRIVPVHVTSCIVGIFILSVSVLLNQLKLNEVWIPVGVFILSLSPILVGEITRGHQEGRTYFPGFVGLLLFIGYVNFWVDQSLPVQRITMYWVAIACLLLVSAGWNLYLFLYDVLPSRMSASYLARALKRLGIEKFYTYDVPFNDGFVNVLPQEILGDRKIEYIKRLSEINDGYVVVPGTSSKASTMVCVPYAMEHGDFDEDPILNRLLDTRKIWTYSIASFKTFGCSRIWVHENEVTSYQDLILRCITSEDRWRGRAWIIDAGKLHSDGWIPASTASVPASALS